MKNTLKIISLIAFVFVLIINLMMDIRFNNKAKTIELKNCIALAMAVSVPNTATCYSTYNTGLIFRSTIWVCGSCTQTKAASFSDSGVCNF